MIRRAAVFMALVIGVLVAPAATSPAGANIVCTWNVHPLNVGICIGV